MQATKIINLDSGAIPDSERLIDLRETGEAPLQVGQAPIAASSLSSPLPSSQNSRVAIPTHVPGLEALPALTSVLAELVPRIQDLCATRHISSAPPYTPHSETIPRPPSSAQPATPISLRPSTQSRVTDHGFYVLQLASGLLTYQSGDVPSPPSLSFTTSIADMNCIWDDQDSTLWNHTSPLEILNVRIPVIYWRDIYRGRPSGHWSRMKQRWLDWKVCVFLSVLCCD